MSNTVVSYPIPLYSNPSPNPQYFKPRYYQISAVTQGLTTTLTTTSDNDYVVGQLVRFIIPEGYGIRELNNLQAYVISIPASNQIEVDIDSNSMSAFIAAGLPNIPQVIAIGNINYGAINADGPSDIATYPPGAFINISPQ